MHFESFILAELAPFLVMLLLKGGLLFAVALAVSALMRRRSASSRHVLWTAVLAASLVLPLLLWAVPGWHVPLVTTERTETVVIESTTESPSMVPVEASSVPSSAVNVPPPAEAEAAGSSLSARALGVASATGSAFVAAVPDPLKDWRVWLGMIWLMGVVAVVGRWMLAFSEAGRLVGEAEPVRDRDAQRLHERISDRLGIDRPVRLLRSERLAVPVAWSFGNDAVVLPADWDEWDDDRLEVVLTHELAHVARRDGRSQLVAQAAVALHWMNPLAWVAYSHFLREREQACDDVVLTSGTVASTYAEHLLAVAQRFRQDSLALLAVASMARRAELSGRIESILEPGQPRGPASWRTTALAGLVVFGLAVPLAAFQPFERTSADEAESLPEAGEMQDPEWRWEGEIASGSTLELYGLNGAIEITQGTGSGALVEGVPRRAGFDAARLVVERQGDRVAACIVYDGQQACAPGRAPSGRPSIRLRNAEVALHVTVPRGVRVTAQTTNGQILSDELDQSIDARTTNGRIQVASRADVTARSTNGRIDFTAGGRPEARTTNGAIRAHLLATNWTGDATLTTTNGRVNVTLPAGANLDLDARTRRGSINTSGFNLETTTGRSPRATGRIGDGGRSLTIQTTLGSITVNSAGDQTGAATSPTTRRNVVVNVSHSDTVRVSSTTAAFDSLFAEQDWDAFGRSIADAVAAIDIEGIVATSLEAAMISLDAAELGTLIDEEVRRSLEEARHHLDEVDEQQIREDVRRALDEARHELDNIQEQQIHEEVKQALEETRQALEKARRDLEEG